MWLFQRSLIKSCREIVLFRHTKVKNYPIIPNSYVTPSLVNLWHGVFQFSRFVMREFLYQVFTALIHSSDAAAPVFHIIFELLCKFRESYDQVRPEGYEELSCRVLPVTSPLKKQIRKLSNQNWNCDREVVHLFYLELVEWQTISKMTAFLSITSDSG